MPNGRVKIIPLGGMEEIGKKNCYAILYTCNGVTYVLFLDYGQKLPPLDLVVGPDNILPDEFYPNILSMLKRDYLIEGVLFSHIHRDHAAGAAHLERQLMRAYPERSLPPVFVSRFGERVIKNIFYGKKLAEDGKTMVPIKPAFPMENPRWDEPYRVGPFTVSAFPVIHSTPGCLGFYIEVGGKHILYLGDFKLLGDYHEQRAFEERMEEFCKRGVDVLLLDSTNAQEDGRAFSERDALNNIKKVMLERRHSRMAIISFASHVGRGEEIIKMARKQRRSVHVLGTSNNHYLQAGGVSWEEGWHPYRWEINEAGRRFYPTIPQDAIVLVTGIEAEPNSGIFKLLQDVPCWDERKDAIMFSGSTIPHPDIIARTESALSLASQRCKTLYLARNEIIFPRECSNVVWGDYHFSGHPKRGDLKELVVYMFNSRVGAVIPGHAHQERRQEVKELFVPHPQISVQLVEEGEEFDV